MNSIKINTGKISLCVNDDPSRVISFNPDDTEWAARFYEMISQFDGKQAEFEARAKEIKDADFSEKLKLMRDVCQYMRDQIDHIFGAGTSEKAFEDAMTLDMFGDFFSGIIPYIEKARQDKAMRYLGQVHDSAVMK